jgi:hypothetical protein
MAAKEEEMAMKAVIEKEEDIPDGMKDEYKKSKVGDKEVFVLDIDGFTLHPSAKKLVDEAASTRIKLKTVSTALESFGDLKPDDVRAQLERIPELEAAAEGKLDEAKIGTIVESRVKARVAPIERERDQLKVKVGEQANTITTFQQKEVTRTIRDSITSAARKAKVVDTAVEDAIILAERVFQVGDDGTVVTKDNVGFTPGITPDYWLQDMQEKRPHWFGTSSGGGAGPGRQSSSFGENPFSHEHWNMTAQGKMIRENRSQAEKAAKAAGTSIGGPKPPPKK